MVIYESAKKSDGQKKKRGQPNLSIIDGSSVVCSVAWPLNGSEAAGDLALTQTSLHLSCKCT